MQKKFVLQYVCCFILLLSAHTGNAQNDTIIKYYDSLWRPVAKDSAMFFTQFVKKDSLYQCTSYWIHSKKLNCNSTYSDTLFKNRIGAFQRFYENGQTEDSNYYINYGITRYAYHYYKTGKLSSTSTTDESGNLFTFYKYYENGKLWVHHTSDKSTGEETTEGYDVNGKKIDGFIYEQEAAFPGGNDEWKNYLGRKLRPNVPVKNGAPKGVYQVIVRFIVSKNGSVSDVDTETHFGYGMEEEAMRVIKASPKWIPAIQNNRPVNAYRRQPITFMVEER